MEHSHFRRGVIVAGMIALGFGGRSWGEDHRMTVEPPAGLSPSIARFYTAPLVNVGEFPGMLVRLSCKSNGSADPRAQGERMQEDYALVIQGDDIVHPLLPGTDEARRELRSAALRGTDVTVHGKYYPSTGMIFASRVAERNSGAVHDPAAPRVQTVEPSTTFDGARLARCASE